MSSFVAAAVVTGVVANTNKNAGQHAKDRANRYSDTAEGRSIAGQNEYKEQTRDDWSAWRDLGNESVGNLLNPTNFMSSPGYQWRMDEGMRNTENRFSAKGGGGNAMKALNDYGQNMAKNEYGSWINQQLAGANLGSQGNAATQQAGQNAANMNQNSLWRNAENKGSNTMQSAANDARFNSEIGGAVIGGMNAMAGGVPGADTGFTGFSRDLTTSGTDADSFNNDVLNNYRKKYQGQFNGWNPYQSGGGT
jgi:hypothetical protein